ncbi:MAG TPA: DUF222 domain-containing protein [Acidimicrobiales bacterium]|nr:DUF222 domain-containing protein [Acidimicrobiales bacterium]
MFPSLTAAVETLDVPVDEAALAELTGIRDRFDAAYASALAAFDRAGRWEAAGATSLKAWLVDHGMAPPDAYRLAATAKRMGDLPVTAAAWRAGDLTGGQVRVVCELVKERHVELFRTHEAAIVPTLCGMDIADTNEVMSDWWAKADALLDPPLPPEPERSLNHSLTIDGRWVTNGAFDPDGGAVIAHALAVAESDDLDTPPPARRGDALVDICRFFLDHHLEDLAPRRRPHISLVVDADRLHDGGGALTDFDLGLDAATVSRYLCDCLISRTVAKRVAKSASRVLDLGRATHIVSPALRDALAVRDRHCRFPGCDRPAAWCEAHHVVWWSKGGRTALPNLVLLCVRHHHLLHARRGYEAELLVDGTLRITTPTGAVRTTRPPGALLSG